MAITMKRVTALSMITVLEYASENGVAAVAIAAVQAALVPKSFPANQATTAIVAKVNSREGRRAANTVGPSSFIVEAPATK
jgi:hypothetical protein